MKKPNKDGKEHIIWTILAFIMFALVVGELWYALYMIIMHGTAV